MNIPTTHAYAELGMVVSEGSGTEKETNVLLAANRYALDRGVNAVFASRASIFLFRSKNVVLKIPHDPASPRIPALMPDSS